MTVTSRLHRQKDKERQRKTEGDDVDAQLVAQLFADMDVNKDGKLSLQKGRIHPS